MPTPKPFTLIQWTNLTGGPYLGCSKVSPGCTNYLRVREFPKEGGS